jgi:hypothetical protein
MTSSNWFNLSFPWTSNRAEIRKKAGLCRLFCELNLTCVEADDLHKQPQGYPAAPAIG